MNLYNFNPWWKSGYDSFSFVSNMNLFFLSSYSLLFFNLSLHTCSSILFLALVSYMSSSKNWMSMSISFSFGTIRLMNSFFDFRLNEIMFQQNMLVVKEFFSCMFMKFCISQNLDEKPPKIKPWSSSAQNFFSLPFWYIMASSASHFVARVTYTVSL